MSANLQDSQVTHGQLLTEADLIALTGKRRPSHQQAFLIARGIGHLIRDDGTLIVTWPAINARLIAKTEPGGGPNLDALNS